MKLLAKKIMLVAALCLAHVLNAAEVNELTEMLDSCYEYISTHTSYDALTLEEQISLKEIIKLAFDRSDELSEQQKKILNELSLWAADILKDEPLYRVPPTPTDLVKIVGGLGLKAANLNTVVLSPALTTSSWTFQFPPDAGNPGDILTTDGTGVITWQASGFSACEIVSSCTYFAIVVPDGPDIYALLIEPNASVQPTVQLAVDGTQPDIGLGLIIRGSSAFYIESDLDTLPLFGFPLVPGGQRGALTIDLQLTRTWEGQVASGIGSALFAGIANTASGPLSIVVGGVGNSAEGAFNAIFGGNSNTTFGGGSAVIAGGFNTASANDSVVIGGESNNVDGGDSVVVGGFQNTNSGVQAAIIAGNSNTINGATGSVILGGQGNSANANYVTVGGFNSSASGSASFAMGLSCFASGLNSTAMGTTAVARDNSSFVWCDGTVTCSSQGANTFNVNASGGVFMPNSITGFTVTGAAVLVDATTGQLGTISSARRYKENIKPMADEYSANVLELQPVTFNYKKTPDVESFGLVADDVLELLPQLVVHNKEGEVETVKYQDLPVLLLNELKKQHALVKEIRSELNALQEQVHMLKQWKLRLFDPLDGPSIT